MNQNVTSNARVLPITVHGDSSSPPPRVLVVDDDRAISELNAQVLKASGYIVDTAYDGAAAWEALRKEHYDLLITDHRMPKLSGAELIQRIRAARMTLPTILVSGMMPHSEFEQGSGLRVDAALHKPYSLREFLSTVQEVMDTAARGRGAACPL